MTTNFADRLLAAIAAKGAPTCVGLDPVFDKLPAELQPPNASPRQKAQAMLAFCKQVAELVAPVTAVVKPQSAYFEVYREAGVEAYFELVRHCHKLGLLVIGDVKRNDIGSTAQAYAAGHLAGPDAPDAVTVNGYLGADGIAPFVDVCRSEGKGIFVLVRTSNPSGAAVQDFADASGRKLYQHVAEMVAAIGAGSGLVGQAGLSCVGAVVGATWPREAAELRTLMPQQVFLVPGYGAQGATAADCAASFRAGGDGAVVNASRSVIFAYAAKGGQGKPWQEAVRQAAVEFASDLRKGIWKR